MAAVFPAFQNSQIDGPHRAVCQTADPLSRPSSHSPDSAPGIVQSLRWCGILPRASLAPPARWCRPVRQSDVRNSNKSAADSHVFASPTALMSWPSRQFPAGRPCSPASSESWSSRRVSNRQFTETLASRKLTPDWASSDTCSEPFIHFSILVMGNIGSNVDITSETMRTSSEKGSPSQHVPRSQRSGATDVPTLSPRQTCPSTL
jgi:hypothetical protein